MLRNELFCHKLKYSYPYILATQCRRPKIFQTINSVRSNNVSLKYQTFISTGSRDIEIRNFEVVAKTQFLCKFIEYLIFLKIRIILFKYMLREEEIAEGKGFKGKDKKRSK